jgi:hypothetical protein
MVDPGLVMDRIVVLTGAVPYTYDGLRETSAELRDELIIEANEIVVIDGNTKRFKKIVNRGVLEIRSSDLVIDGDLINFGTLRIIGSSAVQAEGNIANFGVLDSMTWTASTLTDYSDFGSVLDSSYFRIESQWQQDGSFHIQVPGYEGHRYSLLRTATLGQEEWVSTGPIQYGEGTLANPIPVTFVWPMDQERMFFRVEAE